MSRCFISVDWGTSRLRVRAIERDQERILAELEGSEGVGTVSRADCKQALARSLVGQLAKLAELVPEANAPSPVVISGMASSAMGLVELPYAELPWPLDQSRAHWREVGEMLGLKRKVFLLSGVRSPDDVMRGEETELAGLSAGPLGNLEDDCLIILPGTHCKHVQLSARHITGFRTFLTGELFSCLSTRSSLSSATCATQPDLSALAEGITLRQKEPLVACLFQVRARALLRQNNSAQGAGFMLGCLLADELQACHNTFGTIVLAASSWWSPIYRTALEVMGIKARVLNSSDIRQSIARAHRMFLDLRASI